MDGIEAPRQADTMTAECGHQAAIGIELPVPVLKAGVRR